MNSDSLTYTCILTSLLIVSLSNKSIKRPLSSDLYSFRVKEVASKNKDYLVTLWFVEFTIIEFMLFIIFSITV